jgi:hypothetical protein
MRILRKQMQSADFLMLMFNGPSLWVFDFCASDGDLTGEVFYLGECSTVRIYVQRIEYLLKHFSAEREKT